MEKNSLEEEVAMLRLEVDKLKNMKSEIPPHKHCLNCGISIPPDKTFCSKKCEEEWNAMLRKKKINMYVWLVFMAILILLLFVSMGGAK